MCYSVSFCWSNRRQLCVGIKSATYCAKIEINYRISRQKLVGKYSHSQTVCESDRLRRLAWNFETSQFMQYWFESWYRLILSFRTKTFYKKSKIISDTKCQDRLIEWQHKINIHDKIDLVSLAYQYRCTDFKLEWPRFRHEDI